MHRTDILQWKQTALGNWASFLRVLHLWLLLCSCFLCFALTRWGSDSEFLWQKRWGTCFAFLWWFYWITINSQAWRQFGRYFWFFFSIPSPGLEGVKWPGMCLLEPTRNLFKDDIWDKERTDVIAKVVFAAVEPLNLNWRQQGCLQESRYLLCCWPQYFITGVRAGVSLLMLKSRLHALSENKGC